MTNKPFDVESPFGEDFWMVLGRYASGESPSAEAERKTVKPRNGAGGHALGPHPGKTVLLW